MKSSFIFTTLFLLSNSVFAQSQEIVFPRAEDKLNKKQCIEIKKPCTFDEGKMCSKKYCGVHLSQMTLDNFVKHYRLVGKKFGSLFELEAFLKQKLPSELQYMSINFLTNKNLDDSNYNPGRINVVLDSKEYILSLKIG